jgi:hypothetical protein
MTAQNDPRPASPVGGEAQYRLHEADDGLHLYAANANVRIATFTRGVGTSEREAIAAALSAPSVTGEAVAWRWSRDMSRLPAAVTLLFIDPQDEDGCQQIRLGLSGDVGQAVGWSCLPEEAAPVSAHEANVCAECQGRGCQECCNGFVAALSQTAPAGIVSPEDIETLRDIARVEFYAGSDRYGHAINRILQAIGATS